MTRLAAESISLSEARHLSLIAQRLESIEPKRRGKPSQAELLEIVRAAGVIQLDSISVVSRAHETALWSRAGAFDLPDLSALHHPNQQLIEYWAHAASLLPVEFLPHLRRRMLLFRNRTHPSYGPWIEENKTLLTEVMATIEEQGPVSTRAFERPDEIKRNPWDWWGGKPAKQALDYLWLMGELVVHRRIGFERVYELTDRAFPELRSTPMPTEEEDHRFFTERALHSIGIGTVAWLGEYYTGAGGRFVPPAEMKRVLAHLADEGRAIPVELGDERLPAWLDPDLLPALEGFRSGALRPTRRTLLSPFDNLLWRRERALALFGFDYRLESYTPEPKRIYGYYTLPILIDGALVGRLDARYRRKERRLVVHSLHLEPTVKQTVGLATAIASAIKAFTTFLGGGEIELLSTNPESFQPVLQKRLG